MKLLKYSLALAGLFFISAIIPGIICVLCGFNGVWASSGISLAIVCLLKGKIAKKIFGPNTTHQSSPNAAFFLIAISLISGGIKAYTYYLNKITMVNLGFTYEFTREQVFSQLFVPLIFASLFWAIVLGVVTYIRGKQKRHKVQDSILQSDTTSPMTSMPLESNNDIEKDLKSDSTTESTTKKETPIEDNPSDIISKSVKNEDTTKSNKSFFSTLSNYKKYFWVIFGVIALISILIFSISQINMSHDTDGVGEYLYIDSFGNIHADKNCSAIPSVSVNRIEVKNVSEEDLQHCCHICISDNIYRQLKETYKQGIVEQRLSNIYDILNKYNISNIPSNRSDFDAWIEADQENLQYLYYILSLMRVKDIGRNLDAFKVWLYSDDKSNIELSTSIMRLYNTCTREGLNVGDFNEFIKYIQYNESDMQWIYNKLVELNYDMETYQSFHDAVTALIPYETEN